MVLRIIHLHGQKRARAHAQRYKCVRCDKSFSEVQPLQGVRIERDKAVQVVEMISETMGIRAAGRDLGFAHIEASPLTRSSYHARQAAAQVLV